MTLVTSVQMYQSSIPVSVFKNIHRGIKWETFLPNFNNTPGAWWKYVKQPKSEYFS